MAGVRYREWELKGEELEGRAKSRAGDVWKALKKDGDF